METKPISKNLRILFAIHMVIAGIIGAALWLIPGRTMLLVGWVPEIRAISPEVSLPGTMFFDATQARLLGAALLMLAFASFRGWRARGWEEIALIVQMEAIFCVLGSLAVLYFVVSFDIYQSYIIWVTLIILVVFAIGWGLAFWTHSKA